MSRRPVVIGVAGGTGSGKTTVVRRIVEALGDGHVNVLAHDRYYRDNRQLSLDERSQLNFDHPHALETELLVKHLGALRAGKNVALPVYDFGEHVRKEESVPMEPRGTILVEGILILSDPPLRGLMDIKVFVDTDDDIRFIRRMQRDVADRGRTVESVIAQYLNTVKPMHMEFVEPSRRHADLIVPDGGHNQVAIDMLLTLIRSLAAQ